MLPMIDYNGTIKLMPHDRLMARLILPLVPSWVRPNQITVVRLLTSPIVFWLFWMKNYALGLPVFLLVAFTDALDGSLARVRRQITPWGITYDPVADKFLIGGVMLIVVIKHLGLWLAGFIVGLEVLTLVGALYFKRQGRLLPANLWGKIKMNLQVAGVVALLAHLLWGFSAMRVASFWIFIASIVVGLVSILVHGQRA